MAEVERVDAGRATRFTSPTAARSPTTCWWSPPAPRLLPEETEGLTGPGWSERVFTFYTLDGATRAARRAATASTRGRLVVNMVDLPIKCPVAPLEFCFLADWYLRERGMRDDVELTFVTPLDAAFTKPLAAEHLAACWRRRGSRSRPSSPPAQVDGAGGRLVSWDEREVPFDLLVTIPLHGGAAVRRALAGPRRRARLRRDRPGARCRRRVAPNVFAIGDATNVPTSKAGSVAHFEGETLVANVRRVPRRRAARGDFDGHANCFVETGFHKALLIDFNYEIEPLPGPLPGAARRAAAAARASRASTTSAS